MSEFQSQQDPPTGLRRRLFRGPIWMYKLGLGRLMSSRFLLLTHTGRKSGQPRQAVLEVIDYEPETGTFVVAAGFGAESDWYQNVVQTPQVTIQVGKRKMQALAEPFSAEASGEQLAKYARLHPKAARTLVKALGVQADGSEARWREIGEAEIPCVGLRTRGLDAVDESS